MTYAEVEEKLTKILSEPDTALVNIKPILADIKADYETALTVSADRDKLEGRVKDLQDTNMKLFLAQTSSTKKNEVDEEEDLPTGEAALEEFLNNLINKKEE